jgi:hypothetical protein
MILQFGRQGVRRDHAILQYDERFRGSASNRVGRCVDGRLKYGRMLDEHVLDLRPGDVVAAADDQIVVAAQKPEVSVFVLPLRVEI